jgi:hypothetical protein
MNLFIVPVAFALLLQTPATEPPKVSTIDQMKQEAKDMAPQAPASLAKSLLAGFGCLEPITPMVVHYNKETRAALSDAEASKMTEEQRKGFQKRDVDDQFYYFTRYGTPVAFVRPMEIIGESGVSSPYGLKLLDFGFGSIGQLRALALMGAHVTGVEVDPLLQLMYAKEPGKIKRCAAAGEGPDGSITLAYGQFPKDPAVVKQVGGGYDVFVSKNTLKRGYIHPEQEVDPRMLVHLDVSDEVFLKAVYDALKPKGLFLIYNLCPAPAKPGEPYKPWADGRSPFDEATFRKVGFEVLAMDVDDTPAARKMGETLGWGTKEQLATDLFGVFTIVQKP